MENNNSEKYYDHNDSLGAMIMKVSYPCFSFQEKIDIVNSKFKNIDKIEQFHIDCYKLHFERYYENEEQSNFYGLKLELPKIDLLP
jgi:hypothetical protein